MENETEKTDSLLTDVRALLILLLKSNKVEGKDIAKSLGMSESGVSKLLNKSKYGAKNGKN